MSDISAIKERVSLIEDFHNLSIQTTPHHIQTALFQGAEVSQEDIDLKIELPSLKEHSWSLFSTIQQNINWFVRWDQYPVIGQYQTNSRLYSLLVEAFKKDGRSIRATLNQIYGERLVDEIIREYKLDKKQKLTPLHLEIFMNAAAARVTSEDLRSLFKRLVDLKAHDREVFLQFLGEKDFKELKEVVKHTDFDSLADAELEKLLNFFRQQRCIDGTSKFFNPMDTPSEAERLLSAFAIPTNPDKIALDFEGLNVQKVKFMKDLGILKLVHSWNDFASESEPDLAFSEFLARDVAYTHIRNGVILSLPSRDHTGPTFFNVEDSHDSLEFGCCMLTGLSKKRQYDIKFVARGTVMLSNVSWAGNFGKASGLDPFMKYESSVLKMIERAARAAGENFTLSFIGHSQGGAISQHTCEALVHRMTDDLEKGKFFPWNHLKDVKLYAWNSPAYTKKQDDRFSEDLLKISQNPHTTKMELDFAYGRAYHDIVHTLGEVFAGHSRKTNNLNVRVLYYSFGYKTPIIEPHTKHILLKSEPNVTADNTFSDNRKMAYRRQKQLEIMEYIIRHKKILRQLGELAQKHQHASETIAQTPLCKMIQYLRQMDLENLQNMVIDAEKWDDTNQNPDANAYGLKNSEYLSMIQLFIALKEMEAQVPLLTALMTEMKDWSEDIKNLSLEDLKIVAEDLRSVIKEHEEADEKKRIETTKYLEGNYEQLPGVLQTVVGPMLNYSKKVLTYLLSPWSTEVNDYTVPEEERTTVDLLKVMRVKDSRRKSVLVKETLKEVEEELIKEINGPIEELLNPKNGCMC